MIAAAKKGDKDALVRLIMNKKNEFYSLAYSYTGNKEDSLDALQDMIIILFNNIRKLRSDDAFYSWSKKILVNCLRNMLNKKKRLISLPEEDITESEDLNYRIQTRTDLLMNLSKLNKHQLEAIKLRYFLDMDYKTISYITNVSEGTAKSRVFNGLKKLRKLMGDDYL